MECSNRNGLIQKIEELGIEIVKTSNDEVCCKCPFHSDENPSFFFNLKTQKFHCFAGCIKGRGIHQLVYKLTGVSVSGNPVYETPIKKFILNREKDKSLLPLIPILPLAINNVGEKYLNNRGVDTETIYYWNIQYWEEEKAIVIPIDTTGYVLRYIDKNAQKKYKYVAGTRITETLFGINKLPKTLSNIILTEGSLDCIHLHQLGFNNSLALLHADISTKQIRLLGGLTDYVYLMLDGDLAGREGAKKIKKMLNSNFIVKICDLPDKKDPDNLTKNEVEKILKNAK